MYLLLIFTPLIPIVTRKHFVAVQSTFIFIWLLGAPFFRQEQAYRYIDWPEFSFNFAVLWILGSLIALYLLMKQNFSIEEIDSNKGK